MTGYGNLDLNLCDKIHDRMATTISYFVDGPYGHVKPLLLIRGHGVHEGDWSLLEDVKGELKPAN